MKAATGAGGDGGQRKQVMSCGGERESETEEAGGGPWLRGDLRKGSATVWGAEEVSILWALGGEVLGPVSSLSPFALYGSEREL